MAVELITGISVFKSMLETAKSLKDMNDTALRNSASIELQEKILAVQTERATLVERVGQLEKEVTRFETWDAEKKRYKLHDFGGGTFAYIPKEGMENDETPHRLCTACFEGGKKSTLQSRGQHTITYFCPICKNEFNFKSTEGKQRSVTGAGFGSAGPREDWEALF